MNKLSAADKAIIRYERDLRKNGFHLTGPITIWADNDYMEFLGKCYSHAARVGDFEIAEKLNGEMGCFSYSSDDHVWRD